MPTARAGTAADLPSVQAVDEAHFLGGRARPGARRSLAWRTTDWSWPYPCHRTGHVFAGDHGHCLACGVGYENIAFTVNELVRGITAGALARRALRAMAR